MRGIPRKVNPATCEEENLRVTDKRDSDANAVKAWPVDVLVIVARWDLPAITRYSRLFPANPG